MLPGRPSGHSVFKQCFQVHQQQIRAGQWLIRWTSGALTVSSDPICHSPKEIHPMGVHLRAGTPLSSAGVPSESSMEDSGRSWGGIPS